MRTNWALRPYSTLPVDPSTVDSALNLIGIMNRCWNCGAGKNSRCVFVFSFLHFDAEVGDGSGSSTVEQRVRSTFMENSDDMFKVAGLGEQVVQDSQGPAFDATTSLAARERWLLTQHSATVEENNSHIKSFEAANDIAPIADLHWSLAHVHDIDSANLERLMALGAGVTIQSSSAVASLFRGTGGPPFRLIVDSGIAAGGGSDANAGFTMSPWFALYYMVTGKNMIGDQVNAGQSISRFGGPQAVHAR